MAHTQKNIKVIFLADLLIKLHMLIINLARKLFFTEEKLLFEEYDYCKKMIKKHFNKNLIMSTEEEEDFN